jgi:hypothetical protein
MAPIPIKPQPTVEAIYRAIERDADTQNRPHLGASIIGRECARDLWYSFRWASLIRHSGRLLRLFERGQREEAVFVANLRAANVTVYDADPETGRQFQFKDIGGHFGGSMDACAVGLLEAPKTWHAVEMKTHNAKSFAKLQAEGVEKSKPEHAAQMQCYMHWSGMERAFYLAVNKDTDDLYSERLHYDRAKAESLIEKARRLITASEPPARISERPDWYQCAWCNHKPICHESAIPEVSCRTCAHATPELDGDGRWSCARFQCDISTETQRQGDQCPAHVFIPALLPWKAVDASEDQGWIEYDNGVRNGPGGFASREIRANPALCGDGFVRKVKEVFGAEVVA